MWRTGLCRSISSAALPMRPSVGRPHRPNVLLQGRSLQGCAVWSRSYLAGPNRSFLPCVPAPPKNKRVLLSAEPPCLQQDGLMDGCEFPAAIPPSHTDGFLSLLPSPSRQ